MNPQLFYVDGQTPSSEPYHYKECGLDNIYLLNGYQVEEICGEESVTIENLDGLWKAISLHLVSEKKVLSPREIRFLRNQMRLTQVELARLVRVSDQTVARWEKGETELPGPADFAIRTLYLACEAARPEGRQILSEIFQVMTELSGNDEPTVPAAYFGHGQERWTEVRKAA